MKRLVVNADDFGLCQGANLGILRAHTHGIVTSTTLMVNMVGAGEAFQLAKSTPTLGVGIHITLTAGRPLSGAVPSLTDPDGRFLKLAALAEKALRADLEREINAQVDAFLATGLRPTHLDSHHHVHLEMPAVGAIMAGIADRLGVKVRGQAGAPELIVGFYGREQISVDRFGTLVAGVNPGTTAEIMCHPAYLDPYLQANSSYALERVQELATLTASASAAALAAHQVDLISYRDLS